MKNLVTNSEFNYNPIIADTSFPLQTATVAVKANQGVLLAGSVLGKTDTGEVVFVGGATAATAEFILTDDLDTETTDATVNAVVYVSGAFIRSNLVVDGAGTIDDHEADLKKNGLYLKAVQ